MTPSKQPIVYSKLYDHRTVQLRREIEERLASEAEKAAQRTSSWVAEAIYEAYVRGVSDGFAQGVAKAEETVTPQQGAGE